MEISLEYPFPKIIPASPTISEISSTKTLTENDSFTEDNYHPRRLVNNWGADVFTNLVFLCICISLLVYAGTATFLHHQPVGDHESWKRLQGLAKWVRIQLM